MNSNQKINTISAILNMTANLLWSILNITPVFIFCYTHIPSGPAIIALILSTAPIFLSRLFLDKLRISNSTRIYKKFGVRFISRLSQNGSFINSLIRKQFPDHKVIAVNSKSISRLITQTYYREKFHWMLFLFFGFAAAYGCYITQWAWVGILLVCNIVYNVYPVLLQQYIRLKLVRFKEK